MVDSMLAARHTSFVTPLLLRMEMPTMRAAILMLFLSVMAVSFAAASACAGQQSSLTEIWHYDTGG